MTKEYSIKPVGFVQNSFNEPTDNLKIKAQESKIIINDKYIDGLLTVETLDYIDVLFIFHQSDEEPLEGTTKSGNKRGVFASRLPHRPNSIGVTTAKLIKKEGNILTVTGLDALNDSPVIDIKSGDTSVFASEEDTQLMHNAILKRDPRKEIRNNIQKKQTEVLMMKAAQMHGHYCPGLAMGISAAVSAMNALNVESDGMEDLLAFTETNNCFSDGIQFVTGCSFGNNSLIFKDIGKTAFTLCTRDGKGIRIRAKNNSREVIRKAFPDHQDLYQKIVADQNHDPQLIAEYKRSSLKRAFGTLKIPIEDLFEIKEVVVEIPNYAPVHESIICEICGESTMESRILDKDGKNVCVTCSDYKEKGLDGHGIY